MKSRNRNIELFLLLFVAVLVVAGYVLASLGRSSSIPANIVPFLIGILLLLLLEEEEGKRHLFLLSERAGEQQEELVIFFLLPLFFLLRFCFFLCNVSQSEIHGGSVELSRLIQVL